jgi:hypothetical protein
MSDEGYRPPAEEPAEEPVHPADSPTTWLPSVEETPPTVRPAGYSGPPAGYPPAPSVAAAPRRSGSWLVAAVAVVLAAAGGLALGVELKGQSHGTSAGSTAASAPGTPSSTGAGSGTAAGRLAGLRTRGTIVSESGSTWMVRTAGGQTVSVLISATTTFGTKAKPVARSQFTPGTEIVVIGRRADSTMTAVRVARAPTR